MKHDTHYNGQKNRSKPKFKGQHNCQKCGHGLSKVRIKKGKEYCVGCEQAEQREQRIRSQMTW